MLGLRVASDLCSAEVSFGGRAGPQESVLKSVQEAVYRPISGFATTDRP
jgi:hypothetical protein